MSFAVWDQHPPFKFDVGDREQIYKVGDKWVVTDDPSRATQAEVDAVRSPSPAAPADPVQKLRDFLNANPDVAAIAGGAKP